MNFIVMCIIPIFIATILIVGLKEKKDIFKLFVEGCLEGLKMVYKIFPYIFTEFSLIMEAETKIQQYRGGI